MASSSSVAILSTGCSRGSSRPTSSSIRIWTPLSPGDSAAKRHRPSSCQRCRSLRRSSTSSRSTRSSSSRACGPPERGGGRDTAIMSAAHERYGLCRVEGIVAFQEGWLLVTAAYRIKSSSRAGESFVRPVPAQGRFEADDSGRFDLIFAR
jgi:hypothetical protein